jgi:hypothetical protein
MKLSDFYAALQITAFGGQRDNGLFHGLQPGALSNVKGGIARGRIATGAKLF